MNEKQIKAKKKEKSEGKTTDKPDKSKKKMTDTLVKIDQKLIVPEKCTFTKTSLILDESISDEDYLKVGKFLTKVKKSLMWWIGDWCAFGEFNENFYFTGIMLEIRSHYSDKSIYNATWVCHKIEPSRRREKLEFGHHEAVASLEPEEQDNWLERAEKERFSVMKLRRLIKCEKLLAEAKEYEEAAIVTDNWGKSFYYLDYIHRCREAMSEAAYMVDVLCSWRDRYSFDFYSDNNNEVIAFLEKANKLLKSLKDLLGRGINDDEDIKEDSDDIEEPKDEPKIEEVKKEEVAPEDIENLVDD